MSNKEKERRCKSCRKLLLDERIPFCRRCILEGRNKVGPVGSIVSGLATLSVITLLNNNFSDTNDTDDTI